MGLNLEQSDIFLIYFKTFTKLELNQGCSHTVNVPITALKLQSCEDWTIYL